MTLALVIGGAHHAPSRNFARLGSSFEPGGTDPARFGQAIEAGLAEVVLFHPRRKAFPIPLWVELPNHFGTHDHEPFYSPTIVRAVRGGPLAWLL
jgi:hypothetical protein